LQNMID